MDKASQPDRSASARIYRHVPVYNTDNLEIHPDDMLVQDDDTGADRANTIRLATESLQFRNRAFARQAICGGDITQLALLDQLAQEASDRLGVLLSKDGLQNQA